MARVGASDPAPTVGGVSRRRCPPTRRWIDPDGLVRSGDPPAGHRGSVIVVEPASVRIVHPDGRLDLTGDRALLQVAEQDSQVAPALAATTTDPLLLAALTSLEPETSPGPARTAAVNNRYCPPALSASILVGAPPTHPVWRTTVWDDRLANGFGLLCREDPDRIRGVLRDARSRPGEPPAAVRALELWWMARQGDEPEMLRVLTERPGDLAGADSRTRQRFEELARLRSVPLPPGVRARSVDVYQAATDPDTLVELDRMSGQDLWRAREVVGWAVTRTADGVRRVLDPTGNGTLTYGGLWVGLVSDPSLPVWWDQVRTTLAGMREPAGFPSPGTLLDVSAVVHRAATAHMSIGCDELARVAAGTGAAAVTATVVARACPARDPRCLGVFPSAASPAGRLLVGAATGVCGAPPPRDPVAALGWAATGVLPGAAPAGSHPRLEIPGELDPVVADLFTDHPEVLRFARRLGPSTVMRAVEAVLRTGPPEPVADRMLAVCEMSTEGEPAGVATRVLWARPALFRALFAAPVDEFDRDGIRGLVGEDLVGAWVLHPLPVSPHWWSPGAPTEAARVGRMLLRLHPRAAQLAIQYRDIPEVRAMLAETVPDPEREPAPVD